MSAEYEEDLRIDLEIESGSMCQECGVLIGHGHCEACCCVDLDDCDCEDCDERRGGDGSWEDD